MRGPDFIVQVDDGRGDVDLLKFRIGASRTKSHDSRVGG